MLCKAACALVWRLSNTLGRGEEIIQVTISPLAWMALVDILEKTVRHDSVKRDHDEMQPGFTEDASFQINIVLSRKALITWLVFLGKEDSED